MFNFLKNRFQKIKTALSKTRIALTGKIAALFGKPWNEETFEQLEQILYEADLGTTCSLELVDELRLFLKKHSDATLEEMLQFLHAKAIEILETPAKVAGKIPGDEEPLVILIVGVNGSGKTTSIAKLAQNFLDQKKKVLLAAGDTFRAAAIEQLDVWAKRLDIPIIKAISGGDPAAVAHDAVNAAIARGIDVVLIDTAGRLQNKTELMRELEKMNRVIKKILPHAPHETLLVLDATTGQNALDQAEAFHAVTPLTGIILTKLDSTAKGGIILAIYRKLGIPVRWVGVGEQLDDLMPFEPSAYADAIFKEK